jgi:hypothetical protein
MLSLAASCARCPQVSRRGSTALRRGHGHRTCCTPPSNWPPICAEDIGSARWFRAGHADRPVGRSRVAFWPDFTAVEAATAMPVKTAPSRRIPQPDDPAARARRGQRPPHGRDRAGRAARPRRSARWSARRHAGPGRQLWPDAAARGRGRRRCDGFAPDGRGAVPLGAIAPGTQLDITLGKRRRERRSRARSTSPSAPGSTSNWHRAAGRGAGAQRPARSRSTRRRCGFAARSAPASTARRARPARRSGDPAVPARSTPTSASMAISRPRHVRHRRRLQALPPAGRAPGGRTALCRAGTRRQAARSCCAGARTGSSSKLRASASRRSAPWSPVAGRITSRYRHAPPSDPRLCADAWRGRLWRRLRHADLRGERRDVVTSPGARRARQLCADRPRRRHGHRLCAHEPHRGRSPARGCGRAGDRLCRLDRAFDRPAPALRSLSNGSKVEPAVIRFTVAAQVDGQGAGRLQGAAGAAAGRPAGRCAAIHRAETGGRSRSPNARSTAWQAEHRLPNCANGMAEAAMTAYPALRLRRTRATAWSRALHRETVLTPADLIWPLFVTEGQGRGGADRAARRLALVGRRDRRAGEGGGRARHSLPRAVSQHAARPCAATTGREALNPDNLMCRAIRAIRDALRR